MIRQLGDGETAENAEMRSRFDAQEAREGLSGGERTRRRIAFALSQRAPLLLADEPTGNLDSRMGAEVMDILHRLNREDGRTIVMVTHNEEQARQTSRTIRFFDGRQVE